MSLFLFDAFLFNLFVSTLVGGIVFINVGYKLNRNLKLIKTGWIIIGSLSLVSTALITYLSIRSGIGIILLLFVFPLAILAGIVVTLSLGIYYLVKGYIKKNTAMITGGWVCLIINSVVVTAIITLVILFSTGVIAIRLM